MFDSNLSILIPDFRHKLCHFDQGAESPAWRNLILTGLFEYVRGKISPRGRKRVESRAHRGRKRLAHRARDPVVEMTQ